MDKIVQGKDGKEEKMEINVSFKKSECQLYWRIKKLRSQSSFMKEAAEEKFQREDELKAMHNQPRRIKPPGGLDI